MPLARICIFGAGAIGGLLGARLATSGAEVALVARGPHLAAMRERGLRLIGKDGEATVVSPRCTDDPATLGSQDLVIFAVKAPALAAAAAAVSAVPAGAGFAAPVSANIRENVWNKLWGNAAFNPLSVLTGATLYRLSGDPDTQGVARRIMVEVRDIAARLGVVLPADI